MTHVPFSSVAPRRQSPLRHRNRQRIIAFWFILTCEPVLSSGTPTFEQKALHTTASAITLYTIENGRSPLNWEELRSVDPPIIEWDDIDKTLKSSFGYTLTERYTFVSFDVEYFSEDRAVPAAKLLLVRNVPIKAGDTLERLVVALKSDGIAFADTLNEEVLQRLLLPVNAQIGLPPGAPEFEVFPPPSGHKADSLTRSLWGRALIGIVLVIILSAGCGFVRKASLQKGESR